MKGVVQKLVLVLFLVSIVQAIYLIKTTTEITSPGELHGQATGILRMCINSPPYATFENCPLLINQTTVLEDNSVECQINIVDPEGDEMNWFSSIYGEGINISINETGFMNLEAREPALGIYTLNMRISDVSVCSGNASLLLYQYEFEVLEINDPPYLISNMPGAGISAGSTASVYFLDNFFADYEDLYLNYTVSGNSNIGVNINTNTTEVKISVPLTFCSIETIYFTAIDSGNLTKDSNMIQIEGLCVDSFESSPGGGGGGSSCTPEWECRGWTNCFVNGTRSRECVDLNGCDPDNLKKVFWEECEYIPTCFDGIKNQGEQSIDCGGPCPACFLEPSCFDGLKNGNEEGIDCGGSCEACPEIIPTCFDGIKNQNETGIDCGGPCEVCKQIQVPSAIEATNSPLVKAAIITGVSLLILAMLYLIFKKEIKAFIAKIGWLITRKHRRQILLSNKDKTTLLKNLQKIEKKLSLQNKNEVLESDNRFMQLLIKEIRLYFSTIFGIPFEFTPKEINKQINKMILLESLQLVFESYLEKLYFLENNKAKISKLHFLTVLEELRLLILFTSKTTKEDYFFETREFPIVGDDILIVLKLIHNSIQALQYFETKKSKQKYLKALEVYSELSDERKELIYKDINRLYNEIKCVISWK
ncbi:hypothetical protein K9L67_00760 [Candidatus Woesearchaeota archaeon]|nr:hypothetical protein [Candidatus Woesearchaeota archaeon]MCF7900737.1 hypothetical protein [Candidatus Woesearchaeota archaeon]MCF8012902.1 hypothetical protein [Candidatus Woesearchaeota archaeon]